MSSGESEHRPLPPEVHEDGEGSRLTEILNDLAVTAARSLQFEAVVVNLRQPDGTYKVVACAGPDDGLLGSTTSVELWQALLRDEYRVSGSYLIPPEHTREVMQAFTTERWSVPDIPPAADPDAWDPFHMLVVPLIDRRQEAMGLFSVDRPVDGKLPTPERIAGMSTFAQHAALAVENAQLVDQLAREAQALRRSEERFRSLIRNASDVITVLGPDATIRYESPSVERVLGYSPEELTGRNILSFVHPEDVPHARNVFAEGLRVPGTALCLELRFRHKDGSWRHLEIIGNNLLHDPSVGGVVVNSRDITERKRAEEELQRQNEYLAALHDTALALMNRLDLNDLLEAIVTRAGALVGTPHGYIYLLEPGQTELEARVGVGVFSKYVGYRLGFGEGLGGKVWQTGQPLVIDDYDAWSGRHGAFARDVFRAVVGVPLKSGSEVVGVIGLAHLEKDRKFGARELELLGRFAQLASIALDNARLYTSAQQELAERKRIEAALRQSEAQFRAIYERAGIGIALADMQGRITEINPALAQMLGYSQEELRGKVFTEFTHPDDAEPNMDLFKEMVAGKREDYRMEKRYVRKDGQVVWGLLTVTLARDAQGAPLFVIGLVENITERKRTEEALRRSEASLADAQRIAHLGHWEYDLDTRELRWSDETYRIFGLADQGVSATLELFRDCVHPDDRELVDGSFLAAYEGKPSSLEHRVVRPDGEVRTVHEQVAVLSDDAGRPVRMLGTVQDVTDRKALEAHRYLQRFLAMVTHDLSQPLAILLGRVQLLTESAEPKLSASELRALATIGDAAQRIQRLVADIRDAAHIGANRFEVHPARMDLVALVRQIVEQQQSTTTGHSLLLKAPQRLEGQWDRDRIGQLVTNLVVNAIKYSPQGGEVRIAVREEEEHAVVQVSDQGIGIAPEYRQLLFEPFWRFDRKQTKGKGLGLYISKAIVDAHGGRIWAESEPIKGSTFSVALPLEPLGT